MRLELNDLRQRYDLLLEAKEKASAMYKKDYKKWRDYKRQVYEEAVRERKHSGYINARSSARRKRYPYPSRDFREEGVQSICMYFGCFFCVRRINPF